MIRFVSGSLFESKARTLVNPVNCKGIMGKGLALEFKRRWPVMYTEYVGHCKSGILKIGRPVLIFSNSDKQVLCFPTKGDWREPSTCAIVESGLEAMRVLWPNRKASFESIAFPALGCGLGGLEWAKVKPLFEKHLGDWEIDVEVYEPSA